MRSIPAKLLALFSAAALATGVAGLIATPAQAATVMHCTGPTTADYTPGLSLHEQNVQVHSTETLSSCVGGTVTSGSATADFYQLASCFTATTAVNVVTYHWSTGEQSTVTFPDTTVLRTFFQTTITSTGTVTSGLYEGATVTRVKVLANPGLVECLIGDPPSTHLTGTVELTIASTK